MGELARRYALGAELLQASVTPRVGPVIRGRLEGGLLFTAAYISRIKAQARTLAVEASRDSEPENLLQPSGSIYQHHGTSALDISLKLT